MSRSPFTGVSTVAWLLTAWNAARKLLMFGAFFDDSGTDRRSRIAALAGYVAPEAEWRRFEVPWAKLIEDAGVPYFRAWDCVNCDGVFAGKSEEECRKYYERALRIIFDHDLMGISIAARSRDFTEERIRQAKYIERAAAGAFELSAQFTFMALGQQFLARWPNETERITIICENGKPQDNECVRRAYYDLTTDDNHKHMASIFHAEPAFFPKEYHLGLQAADVLAYEVGQEMVALQSEPNKLARREWRLLDHHAALHGGILRVSVPAE